MAAPFTITSVSNYNSNPPPDDGSQVASNRVQWSTQKSKLADPIKTAFDSSEINTSTAFGKVRGGAGFTKTGVNYTVAAGDQGKTVIATASGITVTSPDATVVGSPFLFGFLNNSTGDVTFAGNGSQTVDGDLSFTVPVGCGFTINTDGSNWFTDGRNFNNVLQQPGGYLTLTTGTPVITGDVTASTSVFYTPDQHDRVPISTDGATFKMRQFSELTLILVANHLANTLYDAFLFDNSGTITIGTGPAWNNSGGGTGARGTGAGTTELQRLHGLFTNKNSMTARNGATTYTVAANQGLYVGTIWIDSVAGQISCHRSWGQSRKWGISNAFHRRSLYLQAGDSTASWNYNSGTIRPSNNASANSLTVIDGLAQESVDIQFDQLFNATTNSNAAQPTIGIGVNSTTAFITAFGPQIAFSNNTATNIIIGQLMRSRYLMPPSLGINTITSLEKGAGAATIAFQGTNTNMLLAATWRG